MTAAGHNQTFADVGSQPFALLSDVLQASFSVISSWQELHVRQQMSRRPLTDCRLKIDGSEIRAAISLHFGQGGFSLWDDAPGARAHFSDLAPRSVSLRDLMQLHAGRAFEVDLLDKKLGWIDEFRGYAAADMGPHTRRVASLRFGLSPLRGRLAFRFEGIAGPVDPGSMFQGSLTAFMRSEYRFNIAFEIANDDLQAFEQDAVALQALQTYIESGS